MKSFKEYLQEGTKKKNQKTETPAKGSLLNFDKLKSDCKKDQKEK